MRRLSRAPLPLAHLGFSAGKALRQVMRRLLLLADQGGLQPRHWRGWQLRRGILGHCAPQVRLRALLLSLPCDLDLQRPHFLPPLRRLRTGIELRTPSPTAPCECGGPLMPACISTAQFSSAGGVFRGRWRCCA